ncbi:hypothetical protein OPT61_g654 [Boeremia exigua]|uniref:Uncharacterized protein n=1 Tax=Boeremia exigua TaxID=749465 RepID=A0ACC2ISY5_9PLEO|nr:hypothetical protein OPT61_g654 [Boeremia exigua]
MSKDPHAEPPSRTLPQTAILAPSRRQVSQPIENGSVFRADVARKRQAAPDSAHHSLWPLRSPVCWPAPANEQPALDELLAFLEQWRNTTQGGMVLGVAGLLAPTISLIY